MHNDKKAGAIERIKHTPELSSLRHLEYLSWNNNDEFWDSLLSISFYDLRANEGRLSKKNLIATAYHEAGHAVVAYLTNIKGLMAEIHFPFESKLLGVVHINYNYPDSVIKSDFGFWRKMIISLAGYAAMEKYLNGMINSGFYVDIGSAVQKIREIVDETKYEYIRDISFKGTYLFINNKIVWQAIKDVADALYAYGSLNSVEISEIIEKQINGEANLPLSIKTFVDIAVETDTAFMGQTSMLNDEWIQKNRKITQKFYEGLNSYLPQNVYDGFNLHKHFYEGKYWQWDKTVLDKLINK
jgi:hypothetical protein